MDNLTATLNQLTAPDLLNLIDRLHEIGIQDEVPLPQIIVIGSQSSGKSSVLEAISRLSFPRGPRLTTTFATEIALRKSNEISVRAYLIADKTRGRHSDRPARSDSQERAVSTWSKTLSELSPEKVAELVDDARIVINKNSTGGSMSFSFDKLRIEASGPDFPLLTIIDLPGLILTANENQTKQDVQDAEAIVRSYAENEHSLMLAIITAETELVNQKALQITSEFDPKGDRTIGVITKPDILQAGHERIDYLVKCARGKIEQFKLQHGWFILKNRNFDAMNLTAEQRDAAEKSFFASGSWSRVDTNGIGASQLRVTLSRLQEEKVRAALPNIIQQIDEKLKNCDEECEKLGPGRSEEKDQRSYLDRIAMDFSQIVQQAVQGHYLTRRFFREAGKGEPRELRAHLNKMYKDFASDLILNGWTTVIVQNEEDLLKERTVHPPRYPPDQEILTTLDMLSRIEGMDRQHEGFTLDGMIDKFRLVSQLFEEQTTKWERIATKHVQLIFKTILRHLYLVTDDLASQDTASKIQTELLRKLMAVKQREMLNKVKELATPYREWPPLTLNRDYTGLVATDSAVMLKDLPINDMKAAEQYATTLSYFTAFYKTARAIFIDNVVLLAVEMIVLKDLHEIFNPSTVYRMDKHKLSSIASEPVGEQLHRDRLTSRLVKLQQAKQICDDYQHGLYRVRVERPRTPDLVNGLSGTISPMSLRNPRTPGDMTCSPGSPKTAGQFRGLEVTTHLRSRSAY